MGFKSGVDADVRSAFPPKVVISIKALACELPSRSGLPLSRLTIPEICQEAVERGLVASIGETTVWRWLTEDGLRPWRYRSWIFPKDPQFEEKATPILELYLGRRNQRPLQPDEYVICADEKTSIQARRRKHPSGPVRPGHPMQVESHYWREGALIYLAAWDVHQARIHGHCVNRMCIAAFDGFVEQVMSQEPYRSASRVFWIVDNLSSHRGQACRKRLRSQWPNLEVMHTPIHASWLNQIEIYFSIVQRKVLSPNDFQSLDDLQSRLLRFQDHYQRIAQPFKWKFTVEDLRRVLSRLDLYKEAA